MKYTEWYFKNGKLQEHELWLRDNVLLETILGSHAYGCETKESDFDVVCIVMPKREHIYPTEYGFIQGFDQLPIFKRKEIKGAKNKTIINNKEVEIEWVSIIEFFYKAGVKGSPNLLETLFAEPTLVTKGTDIGYRLRDNRRLFLSMRTFQAFKGYAWSQYHRILKGQILSEKRRKLVEEYHYDIKMSYQVLRLLSYLEQILINGDIDLRRDKEEWKAMKRGEWGSKEKFLKEFDKRMQYVEDLAMKSNLPQQPRKQELHNLLDSFIKEYYDKEDIIKTEYVSAKEVMEKLNEIDRKLDR